MASRITQSLSFHQSPESFIADRLSELNLQQRQDNTTPIVRAEILNRNVHIVTSYELCKAILGGYSEGSGDETDGISNSFTAGPAYDQLMTAFFPRPNMLLEDGTVHQRQKLAWRRLFEERVVQASESLIKNVTLGTFVKPLRSLPEGHQIDLYKTMKKLAWDVLFAIFLDLTRENEAEEFDRVQKLQEAVLVGQFSLFPVSVRTPFWSSARSRGLKAVRNLGSALRNRLRLGWARARMSTFENDGAGCPFLERTASASKAGGELSLHEDEVVSHLRLFTSSIANKALASLLTAYMLNLFLWRDGYDADKGASLANLISKQRDNATRGSMLKAILMETERLSPPVIGVMRRATETVGLGTAHTIPKGHDAWLYFVAANRDPEIFRDPNGFQWDRFMGQSDEDGLDCGLVFGSGAKRCLGAELVHQICLTVAETVLDAGLLFEGVLNEEGVRNWLGWQANGGIDPQSTDVKQLPCQRPRRPVLLTVTTR